MIITSAAWCKQICSPSATWAHTFGNFVRKIVTRDWTTIESPISFRIQPGHTMGWTSRIFRSVENTESELLFVILTVILKPFISLLLYIYIFHLYKSVRTRAHIQSTYTITVISLILKFRSYCQVAACKQSEYSSRSKNQFIRCRRRTMSMHR